MPFTQHFFFHFQPTSTENPSLLFYQHKKTRRNERIEVTNQKKNNSVLFWFERGKFVNAWEIRPQFVNLIDVNIQNGIIGLSIIFLMVFQYYLRLFDIPFYNLFACVCVYMCLVKWQILQWDWKIGKCRDWKKVQSFLSLLFLWNITTDKLFGRFAQLASFAAVLHQAEVQLRRQWSIPC